LLAVSYNVERGIRESLKQELRSSIKTYQTFAEQRESSMVRTAMLLANLPNVRALMTTEDVATIQDESASIQRLSGSDLLILGNRSGRLLGLQSKSNDFSQEQAARLLRDSMQRGEAKNWWIGGGHLYEVWLEPIYFGPPAQGSVIGVLALGHEIDDRVARDFGSIVSSEIVFQAANITVATSLGKNGAIQLAALVPSDQGESNDAAQLLQIGKERYLATTISLSDRDGLPVTLSVLRSLDKATEFLGGLNHILLGLGLLSVLAEGALVFLLSHTFTRPLSALVAGVRALEGGDFDYPLQSKGSDEVGELTSTFNRMRKSLQKTLNEQKQLEERLRQAHKMEAVGRLAGGVAHDFNNLLTVIRGNSDLLMDRGGSDATLLKFVEQIRRASDRAVTMTRQLLAFSRMQILQPRVLDLNATLAEMNKMIPRLIGEHIEFTFDPDPSLTPVLADPGQIEQVFLNLAVNARDAMPNSGKIRVQTRNVAIDAFEAAKRPPMPPGEYVLFSLSDTGYGMDAETKARIFEPFFTTKEVGRGTGLGLATVYGIVKQSGGYIWVESEKGRGPKFEIYLPSCRKPLTGPAEGAKGKPVPRGNETVLVVEDETGVRELASEFLKVGGYTILEATDGRDGLKLAKNYRGNIHLLLTDMVMPHMSGTELAAELRSARPDLRVIFMTGYSEFTGKNEEKLPGDGVVLQKPFSSQTLLEKVREVLSAAPCKQPSQANV
jgi:signal transduction histidine kinase/ActR/RegA family two-component response regulator